MIKGIDVSHHQTFGDDYYEALNQLQLGFVFIKASEGIYSDAKFAVHSAGFAKTCLLKGAYHFLRFKSTAADQAKAFLTTVNKVGFSSLDLPPVLDVEDPKEEVSIDEAIDTVEEWLTLVKKALGVEPIIYTGGWYWRDKVHMNDTNKFRDYRLWTSRYANTYLPMYGGWTKPTFWQYSETGSLPGHTGYIDLDYFFDDVNALWSMTKDKKLPISPNTVEKIFPVQAALMHLGFYSGKIDGQCGDKTLTALNEWCAKNNLPRITDSITPQHWNVLFNLDMTSAPVVKPVAAVAPTPTPTSNKPTGVVTPSSLKIRSGPGPDKSVVALPLKQGKKVDILSESNGWLYVRTDIEGWVSKPYIQQ